MLIYVTLVLFKVFCAVLYAQLRASQREFIAFPINFVISPYAYSQRPPLFAARFLLCPDIFVGGHCLHVSSREIMKGREIW